MAIEGAPPGVAGRWRGKAIAAGVVIFAATLIAYVPAMRGGFIWDDNDYIENNLLVQGWDTLPRIWFSTETPQYYPLVFTTFWVEHKLWGLHPTGYHIVNIILHALNAILVWRIALRLRIPAAWFIGAVFALHPVHVESVAWVTERKNVMSGLFGLLAIRYYLEFIDSRRWQSYVVTLVCVAAALFSKTVIAMLLASLPLMLFWLRGRLVARDMLPLVPLVAIGALKGLLTAYLEYTHVGAQGPDWNQTMLQRGLLIAPMAYLFYASKILWPHPLIFVYPRWDLMQADWSWYLPFFAIAAAIMLALIMRRRIGWGPVLLLTFAAINLFPALGFLNVYPHRFSFVADHFQYIASLGFIVLYVVTGIWLLVRMLGSARARSVGVAIGAGVLLVLGTLTFRQGFIYANVQQLWERTLRANPDAWMAMTNLGDEYRRQGRLDDAAGWLEKAMQYPSGPRAAAGVLGGVYYRQGRFADAVAMMHYALEYKPRDAAGLHSNIGLSLQQLGRRDEAMEAAREAVRMEPLNPKWHYNLANICAAQGRFDDGAAAIEQAIELAPRDGLYHMYLGHMRSGQRQFADAVAAYRSSLQITPERSEAHVGLVNALFESGKYAEALTAARAGASRFPRDAAFMEQQVRILATAGDDSVRNPAEAIKLADRLIAGVGAAAPAQFIDTLAAAAAASGDFRAALSVGQRALDKARQEGDSSLERVIATRLELYRAGRAYVHTLASP